MLILLLRNKKHWRAWSFELALSAVYVTIFPNLQIAFCIEALFHDPKEHLNKNLSSITYSKVSS
jgi:uncharacterized membrane protein